MNPTAKMFYASKKILLTCGSVSLSPGREIILDKSVGMKSKTRYMLYCILEVANPLSFTTLG